MGRGEKGEFSVHDRRSGFAIIDNVLIDTYGPLIGAYGLAAYCILVRFANRQGTDAYPSYQTVAELMGASRRTAMRAIARLVRLGLIEKEKRKKQGESISNMYCLLDIKRPQVSQVVGSDSQSPRGDSRTLGSDSQSPDQDTINKTPLTRHHDPPDDDDALSVSVKEGVHVGSYARGDRTHDATRSDDPPPAPDLELLALRTAAHALVIETLGESSWDKWPAYRDRLFREQLRLACYWCKRMQIVYITDDKINNPVGFVRDGIESGQPPALAPTDISSIDEFIALHIELAYSGVLTP